MTRNGSGGQQVPIAVDGPTINIEANRRSPNWEERDNNIVETRFETFSGNIDLDVSSASAAPDVKAETFSGNIRTRVPQGSNGRVSFHTFSGDLRSDLPLILHDGSRRNITADLGSGGDSKLDFKTFSGDLRLVK